jgi:hypothetical protein
MKRMLFLSVVLVLVFGLAGCVTTDHLTKYDHSGTYVSEERGAVEVAEVGEILAMSLFEESVLMIGPDEVLLFFDAEYDSEDLVAFEKDPETAGSYTYREDGEALAGIEVEREGAVVTIRGRNAGEEASEDLFFLTLKPEEIVMEMEGEAIVFKRELTTAELDAVVILKLLAAREGASDALAQRQPEKQESLEQVYQQITASIFALAGPHPAVLPEGRSYFLGEYSCAQGRAGSVLVLHRSGGDLTVVNLHGPPISERNPQPVGLFRTVGTYNPTSNRFTEVPDAWLVLQAPGWIMSGRDGLYSSKTGRIEGAVPIGVTWANGEPLCTTFRHSRIARTREMTELEEEAFRPPLTLAGAPMALPEGETRWVGRFLCGGITYDLSLNLLHEEGGRLSGTFHFEDTGQNSLDGSFLVAGTHNPETGRLSLGPRGWIGGLPPKEQQRMYYIDGHHLKSPGRLLVRIITDSGPCVEEGAVTLKPLQ